MPNNQHTPFDVLNVGEEIIQTSFCNVDRASFEEWLRVHDKLNWSEDTSNYRGEHEQHLGRFTIEEYWLTPYVNHDLQEYIKQINRTGKLATLPNKAAMLKKLLDANKGMY